MKAQVLVGPFILLCCFRIVAQSSDRIIINNKGNIETISCTILSADCDAVVYEPDDNQIQMTRLSEEVVKFSIARHNKARITKAEDLMQEGDYKQALELLQKARDDKEIKQSQILLQLIYYDIVECYEYLEKFDMAIEQLNRFKKDIPNTFYLTEVYAKLVELHLMRDDLKDASQVVDEFYNEVKTRKKDAWKMPADLLMARVHEERNDYREALAKYSTYKEKSEDAKLGELRCRTLMNDWDQLKARSQEILESQGVSDRLKVAASNAMGDYYFIKEKNFYEAMLWYLRGVVLYNKEAADTPEHEKAIAFSAICHIRYAASLNDKKAKEDYLLHAQRRLAELKSSYPRSTYISQIEKELKEIK